MWGWLWLSEYVAKLKAFRDTLTNANEIAEMDEYIAELEAKEKANKNA